MNKKLARSFSLILQSTFLLLFLLVLLSSSGTLTTDPVEKVRRYTRQVEFDYITWILNAFLVKNEQAAINLPEYLTPAEQRHIVDTCLSLTDDFGRTQNEINTIYADPSVSQPDLEAAEELTHLSQLQESLSLYGPLCESILQRQVSDTLASFGLTTAGQPIPPILYHITPLPMALVVSRRDRIEQTANISLLADLTTQQIVQIENEVSQGLDYSTLVVPVGGVGVYPTMVMSTTNLPWLLETISHEWIHNYLTLRPLGLSYESTPETRTMNETTASLAGKEIGQVVLQRYYPDLYTPPAPPASSSTTVTTPQQPTEPPAFDFQKEMHQTRLTVDRLLAEGKITEAEAYMEQRREVFWENGYHIRKLNQAYFAFHGAYADVPGGAAGTDPVGPAVVTLRQKSKDLKDFINRIAWMTAFSDLQKAIQP